MRAYAERDCGGEIEEGGKHKTPMKIYDKRAILWTFLGMEIISQDIYVHKITIHVFSGTCAVFPHGVRFYVPWRVSCLHRIINRVDEAFIYAKASGDQTVFCT